MDIVILNLQNSKSRIETGFGIRKIISYAAKCGGKTEFVNENGFKGMVELPIVSAEWVISKNMQN